MTIYLKDNLQSWFNTEENKVCSQTVQLMKINAEAVQVIKYVTWQRVCYGCGAVVSLREGPQPAVTHAGSFYFGDFNYTLVMLSLHDFYF